MDHKVRNKVNEVISEIFASTAFVFPEPANLSDGIDFENMHLIAASLNFNGEKDGSITLIIPLALCKILSENMLGEEFADDDSIEMTEAFNDTSEPTGPVDAPDENETGKIDCNADDSLTDSYLEDKIDVAKEMLNIIAGQLLTQQDLFEIVENQDYVCNLADGHLIILTISDQRNAHEYQSLSR